MKLYYRLLLIAIAPLIAVVLFGLYQGDNRHVGTFITLIALSVLVAKFSVRFFKKYRITF